MRMRDELEQKVGLRFSKGLLAADNKEIYQALLELTQEKLAAAPRIQGERKLYYISAEFLVGKLLSNNLINLGIYDQVKEALREAGKDLSAVEEAEPEPSLGNGGLGRLAACYLDSCATLGLPGDGVGLSTTSACSTSTSGTTSSRRSRTPGSLPRAGCRTPE